MNQYLVLLSAASTVPTSPGLTVPPVEQTTPGATAAASASTSSAPMALLLPEQAELAQLWASALEIDVNDIRASDNFFSLGGDALLAMRVMQQAESVLGLRVEPQRYLFESLAQLATPVAAAAADGAAPQRGLLGRVFGALGRRS